MHGKKHCKKPMKMGAPKATKKKTNAKKQKPAY